MRPDVRRCQYVRMPERLLPPSETLVANGITLRRWRRAYSSALLESVRASLPHLRPWMPWATADYGREQVTDYLTRKDQEWDAGQTFDYAIMIGARQVIGSAGLMSRIGPGRLEIGYWVDTRHTGQGVATRTAAALSAAGLAVPGIDQLEIHHEEANTASGAVARKLGYQRVDSAPREGGGATIIWRLSAAELPTGPIPDILGQRRHV